MEKKLQKPYLDYNLSIEQDLCKVNYQILLIILMKEFIKTKCKYGHDNKKWQTCGIK